MHRQTSEYFETVLSRFRYDFQKGYSTQDQWRTWGSVMHGVQKHPPPSA